MKETALTDAFNLRERGVISLMGAGGKTTLMFQLAKALQKSGKSVLTTTTTKIFMPPACQSDTVILSTDIDHLLEQLQNKIEQTRHITAGEFLIKGVDKISGFSKETVDQLWQSGLFDWIIVEADGAARKPLKACNDTEPVLPGCTDYLILVAGIDALELPLCEDHVHRAPIFFRNSGLPLGQPLDNLHMARGLAVEMKKIDSFSAALIKYIILNKADTEKLEIQGMGIVHYLRKWGVCHGIMVAALESPNPVKKWYDMSGSIEGRECFK